MNDEMNIPQFIVDLTNYLIVFARSDQCGNKRER